MIRSWGWLVMASCHHTLYEWMDAYIAGWMDGWTNEFWVDFCFQSFDPFLPFIASDKISLINHTLVLFQGWRSKCLGRYWRVGHLCFLLKRFRFMRTQWLSILSYLLSKWRGKKTRTRWRYRISLRNTVKLITAFNWRNY